MLPSLATTFNRSNEQIRYATCSLFAGCCAGASFWGYLSDTRGRKPPYLLAMLLTTISGCVLPLAQSATVAFCLLVVLGIGVGGNLPVDAVVFVCLQIVLECSNTDTSYIARSFATEKPPFTHIVISMVASGASNCVTLRVVIYDLLCYQLRLAVYFILFWRTYWTLLNRSVVMQCL